MPRSICTVGRATLTMLVSSTDMNMPTTSTASGSSHDPAPAALSAGTAGGAGRGCGGAGAGRVFGGAGAAVVGTATGAGATGSDRAGAGASVAGCSRRSARGATSTCGGIEKACPPCRATPSYVGRTSPNEESFPVSGADVTPGGRRRSEIGLAHEPRPLLGVAHPRRQRGGRPGAQGVEHQHQVTPPQLGRDLLGRRHDRPQRLQDEAQVLEVDVGAGRALA